MITFSDNIARKPYLGSTEIAEVWLGNTLIYPDVVPPTPSYDTEYLTFRAIDTGTFGFSQNGISYSLDSGSTWESLANDEVVQVTSGNKIMWKAELTPSVVAGIGTFTSTGHYIVYGNPMSLLFGDNFQNHTNLTRYEYAFSLLFKNSDVVSAKNLALSATTLARGCYNHMFEDCTSLTTAPQLPATTLAEGCYESMFYGCTSLTTAPALPASRLAEGCYRGMFMGCISLVNAPELPATNMSIWCYGYMFAYCESLTNAPQLPSTTLADDCYHRMFMECISLVNAPELPATILDDYCYYHMFQHCTSLNNITCLATDISAANCTNNWVEDVAASGTFTKAASMSSWTTGINGIPRGWTVVDATS